MLWMSQRHLLYVMDVSKTSFVCYGCIKDIFCMLWMSQRRLFVCYKSLKDIFCTLWMSQRCLRNVICDSQYHSILENCHSFHNTILKEENIVSFISFWMKNDDKEKQAWHRFLSIYLRNTKCYLILNKFKKDYYTHVKWFLKTKLASIRKDLKPISLCFFFPFFIL